MSLLPSLKFFKISKRAFFLTVEDGVPQPKVQVELRYNWVFFSSFSLKKEA